MENEVVVTTVRFVHSLLTVMWVGGMLTLGIAVIPSARAALGAGPQMLRLMSVIQSRLRWFVYVAIIGLAVTGVMLSRQSADFQGFFAWGDGYSVALTLKHVLMIVMVVVALVRSLALRIPLPAPGMGATPAVQPGGDPVGAGAGRVGTPSGRMKVSMALLYGNIVLGVAVLLLSAVTASVA